MQHNVTADVYNKNYSSVSQKMYLHVNVYLFIFDSFLVYKKQKKNK